MWDVCCSGRICSAPLLAMAHLQRLLSNSKSRPRTRCRLLKTACSVREPLATRFCLFLTICLKLTSRKHIYLSSVCYFEICTHCECLNIDIYYFTCFFFCDENTKSTPNDSQEYNILLVIVTSLDLIQLHIFKIF